VACATALSLALTAGASQHRRSSAGAGSGKTGVLATVDAFEQAYKRKDKKAMIFELMVPTKDAESLEKRYQWFRGFGPKDMPGTKHPPILFETSKGSFVPTGYAVGAIKRADSTHWTVTVREQGTYRDEDGRYTVKRVRTFKIVQYNHKWFVADYVLADNPEDYGFWVDDILDKMTKR